MDIDVPGSFEDIGCGHLPALCDHRNIERLRGLCVDAAVSGQRLPPGSRLAAAVIAVAHPAVLAVRPGAVPVRIVYFDKSIARNWVVPWHQDRTIAVRERRDVPGFGPWSSKAGVAHVEPPFALLRDMITLRVHLDDCAAGNAPLVVALGSQRERVAANRAAEVAAAYPQLACEAQAGDCWIYATPILHRSGSTEVQGRRRVVQVDFSRVELPGGLEWAT